MSYRIEHLVSEAEWLLESERVVDAIVACGRSVLFATKHDLDVNIYLQKLVSFCVHSESPIKDSFAGLCSDLRLTALSRNTSAILTAVGQQLLTLGYTTASLSVLEYSRECASGSSDELLCSTLSALSSAHWSLSHREVSLELMMEQLEIAKQLNNLQMQATCLNNLGMALSLLRRDEDALRIESEHLKVCFAWLESLKRRNEPEENHERAIEGMATALSRKGLAHKSLGNDEEALSFFNKSATVYAQMSNHSMAAGQFAEVALLYEVKGDLANAFKKRLEHLQSSVSGKDFEECYKASFGLGRLSCLLEKYTEALQYFQQARTYIRETKSASRAVFIARARCCEGIAHRLMNELDESETIQLELVSQMTDRNSSCFACSTPNANETQLRYVQIEALTNIGIVRVLKDDLQAALDYFKRCLLLCCCSCGNESDVPNRLALGLRVTLCGYLGSCCIQQNDYESAIKYFTMQVELSSEQDDITAQCNALGNLGLAFQCNKEYANAETSLLKHVSLAANSYLSTKSPVLLLKAHLTVARFYASTEQFTKAVPYFKQVLNTHTNRTQEEDAVAIEVQLDLGFVYFRLEDYKNSLYYFHQSLLLAKRVPQKTSNQNLHRICYNLGVVYQVLRQFESALKWYDKSCKICRSNENIDGELRASKAKADVSVLAGDLETAEEIYSKVCELSKEVENAQLQSEACRCLGFLYMSRNKTDLALARFAQMMHVCKQSGDIIGHCQSLLYSGKVQTKVNNFHVATQYFHEALKEAENIPTSSEPDLGNRESLILDLTTSLAECKKADREFEAAAETFERVLELIDKYSVQSIDPKSVDMCSSMCSIVQRKFDIDRKISALQSIALCHRELGDFPSAASAYSSASDVSVSQRRWNDAALNLHKLAHLFLENEKYTAASETFGDLLKLCELYGADESKTAVDKFSIGTVMHYTCLFDFACLLLHLGSFEEALQRVESSFDFICETDRCIQEAQAALIAGICCDQGCIDANKAVDYFGEVIKTTSECKNPDHSLVHKQKAAAAQFRYALLILASDDEFDDAVSLLEDCFKLSRDVNNVDMAVQSATKLVSVLSELSKYNIALQSAEDALYFLEEQPTQDFPIWVEKMRLLIVRASCQFNMSGLENDLESVVQTIEDELLGKVHNEEDKLRSVLELVLRLNELKVEMFVCDKTHFERAVACCLLMKDIKRETLSLKHPFAFSTTKSLKSTVEDIINSNISTVRSCSRQLDKLYTLLYCTDQKFFVFVLNKDFNHCSSLDVNQLKRFIIDNRLEVVQGFQSLSTIAQVFESVSSSSFETKFETSKFLLEAMRSSESAKRIQIVMIIDAEHSWIPFTELTLNDRNHQHDTLVSMSNIQIVSQLTSDSTIPSDSFLSRFKNTDQVSISSLASLKDPSFISNLTCEYKIMNMLHQLTPHQLEVESSDSLSGKDRLFSLFRAASSSSEVIILSIRLPVALQSPERNSNTCGAAFTMAADDCLCSENNSNNCIFFSDLSKVKIEGCKLVILMTDSNLDEWCLTTSVFNICDSLLTAGAAAVLSFQVQEISHNFHSQSNDDSACSEHSFVTNFLSQIIDDNKFNFLSCVKSAIDKLEHGSVPQGLVCLSGLRSFEQNSDLAKVPKLRLKSMRSREVNSAPLSASKGDGLNARSVSSGLMTPLSYSGTTSAFTPLIPASTLRQIKRAMNE